MFIRPVFVVTMIAFTASFGTLAQAQTKPQNSNGPRKLEPKLPTLYRLFLAYQLHLEKKADDLKRQGRDGEEFRTHYQKILRFSTPEFAKLHTAASELGQDLAQNDKEISKTVTAFRASLSKNSFSQGHPIPAPPEQLNTLFKARQRLIETQVTKLNQSLNKDDRAKLERFLQEDFSRAVTVSSPYPVREHMQLKVQPAEAEAK